MEIIENIKKLVTANPKAKIIFPEGEDLRIIEAVSDLASQNLIIPTILGKTETIQNLAKSEGISLEGVTVTNPSISNLRPKYSEVYTALSKTDIDLAYKILSDPLFFAAIALKEGDVDGMIGGAVYTSGDFETVAKEIIGLKPGIRTPSSFFLMMTPDLSLGENGNLLFADASVNPNPNPDELSDIAIATASTAKLLFDWTPRVAFLSFSTKGSSINVFSAKVAEAVKRANQKAPEFFIDGEMQGDTALIMETAKRKMKEIGDVAGRANVLIFPDLNSGNIAYKLVSIIGKATALGPILQGFNLPLSDLSRGARAEDIKNIALLLSAWIIKTKKQ